VRNNWRNGTLCATQPNFSNPIPEVKNRFFCYMLYRETPQMGKRHPLPVPHRLSTAGGEPSSWFPKRIRGKTPAGTGARRRLEPVLIFDRKRPDADFCKWLGVRKAVQRRKHGWNQPVCDRRALLKAQAQKSKQRLRTGRRVELDDWGRAP